MLNLVNTIFAKPPRVATPDKSLRDAASVEVRKWLLRIWAAQRFILTPLWDEVLAQPGTGRRSQLFSDPGKKREDHF